MSDKNVKLIDTNALLFYHSQLKNLLGDKVDKVDGKSLISDAEITRLASITNYNDTEVKSAIQTIKGQIEALEAGTYDDTALRAELKGYTDTEILKVTNKLTTAMHYCGSVDNYNDLPANPNLGDFYNIVNGSEHNNPGDNCAWNGANWDITSGMIDTTDMFDINDVATNEDITTILNS